MRKLGSLYQGMKKHWKKFLVGGVVVGAGIGLRSCDRNMGQEVYRGEIDGMNVVYEEGRFSYFGSLGLRKNVMTVLDGDKKYSFSDVDYETNIDWKNDVKPDFEKDELEEIVSNDGRKESFVSFKVKMSEWNPTTIDERRKKSIFEDGNKIYNDLRAKIREELRADYEVMPSPFDCGDCLDFLN